ncbi:tetratricopeptide repeat protein [Synechococcus sp. L2F]|uniref:tetratricopeptide repeat protein n=1 Tax=Synechococcus sp. L2F TaxID=2823739 RepID=UPI0020CC9E6C|nr:tetratricopeptide repeat protein [Synechococcus sp. L2F]MCP9828651.1 tetratricopeptide repeat protein [Synechococcus sp. L2F]
MPKVSRRPDPARPNALDVFTDRTGLIDSFERLLAAKQPQENNVLVFYGEGGIGKTTLSQKLQQLLSQQHSEHAGARLDFASPGTTEPDTALFRLRQCFPEIPFPTFTLALIHYAGRFHPEAPVITQPAPLLDRAGSYADVLDKVLEKALDVAKDTPLIGLTLNVIKSVTDTSQILRSWYLHRAEPLLRNLSGKTQQELIELLPQLWAQDFRDGLVASISSDGLYHDSMAWRVPAPVIFLDTYEALWHGGLGRQGEHRQLREEWLVSLVGELPQVLWVITGRNRLNWQPYDPAWEACCEQHLVGSLSDGDATSFLAKRGISDPALVATILEHAAGVPFYLELETQLHDKLPPEQRLPEAFGGTHQLVIERLLSHLEISEAETMHLMASFGTWDAALFRDAIQHFGTGYPPSACERFAQGWSIEQPAPGQWQLHNEMVLHLQQHDRRTRPDTFRDWHRWGFERFDGPLAVRKVKDITSVDGERLFRALAHARHIQEPEELCGWFNERIEHLSDGTIWRVLLPVLEDHQRWAEELFGPDHPEVASTLNNHARLLRTLARYEEAEQFFRRSIAIFEAAYGPDHPSVANTLNNLAGLLRTLSHTEEAELLLRRALAIHEAAYGPDHPEVAITLNNLASLLRTLSHNEQAEPLLRRALSINEEADDQLEVATTLNNLASLLTTLSCIEEAESLFRRALAIEEAAYGADHPSVAITLNNLAKLLEILTRTEEAERLYSSALAIFETTYGRDHPLVASTLNNLAGLLETLARTEEAEPLCRRALAIFEAVYAPDHLSVTSTLNYLANLLRILGRHEEAEPLFCRALALDEAAYGHDDPVVAISLNNLAKSKEEQGIFQEAIPLYERSLETLLGVLGVDHPTTIKVQGNLKRCQDKLNLDA